MLVSTVRWLHKKQVLQNIDDVIVGGGNVAADAAIVVVFVGGCVCFISDL